MSSVLLIYLKYILLCPSVVLLRYGSKNAVRAAISQRSQKRLTKDKKRLGSLHLAYIISKIYIKSKDFIHPGCGENPPSGLRLTPSTRITPADAGKTATVPARACAVSDHPRGCGENLNTVRRLTPAFGSPPRMRGKRICHAVGIICTLARKKTFVARRDACHGAFNALQLQLCGRCSVIQLPDAPKIIFCRHRHPSPISHRTCHHRDPRP